MEKKELIRRLALPREAFRKARTELENSGAYSGGFATSLLQDLVEWFLRIVAERKGIAVGASASFDKLVEEVGKKFNSVITNKAALSRLNKARVGFKHQEIPITDGQAQAFADEVETFLTDVSKNVLEIDFWSVFLVQAVRHRRTKNMLEHAEHAYQERQYGASIVASAKALAVYDSGNRRMDRSFGSTREDPMALRTALLGLGIKYEDYVRYRRVAPSVSMTLNGTLHVTIANNHWIHELDNPVRREQLLEFHGQEWVKDAEEKAEEKAHFCIRFVVDWVLRVQERFPTETVLSDKGEFVLVEKECDLMVNMTDDEVIRRVAIGEKLSKVDSWSGKENRDYVCVLQDNDKAFVRKDCIRLMSERK